MNVACTRVQCENHNLKLKPIFLSLLPLDPNFHVEKKDGQYKFTGEMILGPYCFCKGLNHSYIDHQKNSATKNHIVTYKIAEIAKALTKTYLLLGAERQSSLAEGDHTKKCKENRSSSSLNQQRI
jgi:hypothetical protein